jgi:hypothetical protein
MFITVTVEDGKVPVGFGSTAIADVPKDVSDLNGLRVPRTLILAETNRTNSYELHKLVNWGQLFLIPERMSAYLQVW